MEGVRGERRVEEKGTESSRSAPVICTRGMCPAHPTLVMVLMKGSVNICDGKAAILTSQRGLTPVLQEQSGLLPGDLWADSVTS